MPPKGHGSKTFKNPLGFERGLWQRKMELNAAVPQTSVSGIHDRNCIRTGGA